MQPGRKQQKQQLRLVGQAQQRPREAMVVDISNEDGNQGVNRSNDDGCPPIPTNIGSVLVRYEYNLNIMPGADKFKAAANVDEAMPERIAMELGIWCDSDDEEGVPLGRRLAIANENGRAFSSDEEEARTLLISSADGIYELTKGEPDVIRTDGEYQHKCR